MHRLLLQPSVLFQTMLLQYTGPSEPGGLGGLQPPQYFATICSINFQENIAKLYYKFAKILTSSATSHPFQSFISCSKNQCIIDQER